MHYDQRTCLLSKSPVVLARLAMEVAQLALPTCCSIYSPQIYTLAQYLVLVMRLFFKTDDRGMVAMLEDFQKTTKGVEVETGAALLDALLFLKTLDTRSLVSCSATPNVAKGLNSLGW
jgi:hypothetical protein